MADSLGNASIHDRGEFMAVSLEASIRPAPRRQTGEASEGLASIKKANDHHLMKKGTLSHA
jgi:hypothetical protein